MCVGRGVSGERARRERRGRTNDSGSLIARAVGLGGREGGRGVGGGLPESGGEASSGEDGGNGGKQKG